MGVEAFLEHRSVLVGVAYRILGSAADAEDIVQEAWVRWSEVERGEVADARAFLVRVTTNLAIDRLRRLKVRRESYVGDWLPEPVSTGPEVAERAELADSVELAMLVVLETLSPLERAVFVLREVFGFSHAEIGETIGRAEPAVRQLARRAREHVRERRPRFDVDRRERREVTERFIGACTGGDLRALMELLAKDVTLVSDSGGKARAPRRMLVGVDHVCRFLLAVTRPEGVAAFLAHAGMPPDTAFDLEISEVNGGPAIVASTGGTAFTVISLLVVDGRIETIYLLANPEKLAHIVSE
ncbi:RNA polymerase sigma24 factor [Acrocarpospora corrugata]|uniref:RNA polymerase sigma24 factor n=1 Tax=Acrocarpospora corrugata TaxID=35763 RepID=A0A5M3VW83_9ACTN|nr:RNA polymerase sigma factor SigJ [Acrocarpospora corrugata]GES01097.1 RNA polymerase sigma24 factor [Acrocarpospora corrugata]